VNRIEGLRNVPKDDEKPAIGRSRIDRVFDMVKEMKYSGRGAATRTKPVLTVRENMMALPGGLNRGDNKSGPDLAETFV